MKCFVICLFLLGTMHKRPVCDAQKFFNESMIIWIVQDLLDSFVHSVSLRLVCSTLPRLH